MATSGKRMVLGLMLLLVSPRMAVAGARQRAPAPAAASRPEAQTKREHAPSVDRQLAYSLLDGIVAQARTIDDDVSRIRVQIRIADAWWPRDPERSIQMFQRALDDIDDLDEASNDPSLAPIGARTQLRVEALDALFRHDPVTGSEIAASIEGDFDDVTAFDLPLGATSEYASVLCRIAISMVATDVDAAADLANKSLDSGLAVEFPSVLEALDAASPKIGRSVAANAIARIGLESSNPADLWLLSEYVFDGRTNDTLVQRADAPNTGLERPFLESTVRVTSRFIAEIPVGTQNTGPETVAAYALCIRMAPLFDRYWPEQSNLFRGQIARIEQIIPADRRDLVLARENEPSSSESLSAEAESSSDPAVRDGLYVRAAYHALSESDYKRARATARKIENDTLRERTLADLARQGARMAGDARRFDEAFRIGADLVSVPARAQLFVGLSRVALEAGDRQRAVEFLDEAERLLRKSSSGDAIDHSAAFVLLANAYSTVDQTRGFEVMAIAVDALNKAIWRGKTDGDRRGSPSTQTLKGLYPRCDFSQGLAVLARSDYFRALSTAQSIGNRPLSILGQLSVVKSVLTPKAVKARSRKTSKPRKVQSKSTQMEQAQPAEAPRPAP